MKAGSGSRWGGYTKAAVAALGAAGAGVATLGVDLVINAASGTALWPRQLRWIQRYPWQSLVGFCVLVALTWVVKGWRTAYREKKSIRSMTQSLCTLARKSALEHTYPLLHSRTVDLKSAYAPEGAKPVPVETEPVKTKPAGTGPVETEPKEPPPPLWQNTADNPFSEAGLCLIEGGPGSGKSTLLRRRATELGDREIASGYIPFLIDAVAVARSLDKGRSLSRVLALAANRDLARHGLPPVPPSGADLFEASFTSGPHWQVLIDGLDEVASRTSRTEFVKAAAQWVRSNPRFRVVITTRHVDVDALKEIRKDEESSSFAVLAGLG